MKKYIYIIVASIAALACSKEQPLTEVTQGDLSEYKVVLNTPSTKLTSAGAWEENDVVFIALDGSDAKSFRLTYSGGAFAISSLGTASSVNATSVISALYCSRGQLKYANGAVTGTTTGDIIYTKTGTLVVDNQTKVITITLHLDTRPVSLIKVTNAGAEGYVSDLDTYYTSLTSLAGMTWDTSNGDASKAYIYNSSSGTSYTYGVPGSGSTVYYQYVGGDRQKYCTTSPKAASLSPSEMTTLDFSSGWTEAPFEHYSTGQVLTYYTGSKASRLNIIVTGDGFTKYDLRPEGTFYQRAKHSIDVLFSVEPYKSLKPYFNIYFIPAESNQRGADIGGASVDTYFDTGWNSSTDYNTMITSAGETKLKNFIKAYNADKTYCICLCNSSTYGALCHISETPVICFASVCDGVQKGWAPWDSDCGYSRGDFANLVLHELGGHGIGQLDDEYKSYTTNIGFFNSVRDNLSKSESLTPWSNFTSTINSAGGYVMTDKLGIGVYKCGEKNVYRSDYNGCMTDNRLFFGVWNRYLIARQIHSKVGESYSYSDFIAEIPKQVADPTWKATRSPEAIPSEYSPMGARPKGW